NTAYVTGLAWSGSTTFPMVTAVQPAGAGNYDAFLTKLNSTGTGVISSTFYGGASTDYGTAVTVDSSGSAYVTGLTQSLNYPVVNAVKPTHSGGTWDAFASKLNPSGTAVDYATYLGGNDQDI